MWSLKCPFSKPPGSSTDPVRSHLVGTPGLEKIDDTKCQSEETSLELRQQATWMEDDVDCSTVWMVIQGPEKNHSLYTRVSMGVEGVEQVNKNHQCTLRLLTPKLLETPDPANVTPWKGAKTGVFDTPWHLKDS